VLYKYTNFLLFSLPVDSPGILIVGLHPRAVLTCARRSCCGHSGFQISEETRMKSTRRQFIANLVGAVGAVGFLLAVPRRAHACLYGKWWVVCPRGDADLVDGGTCQHVCQQHHIQVFRGSAVTVRCPRGHDNPIDTAPCGRACTSYTCTAPNCGLNCCVG